MLVWVQHFYAIGVRVHVVHADVFHAVKKVTARPCGHINARNVVKEAAAGLQLIGKALTFTLLRGGFRLLPDTADGLERFTE